MTNLITRDDIVHLVEKLWISIDNNGNAVEWTWISEIVEEEDSMRGEHIYPM